MDSIASDALFILLVEKDAAFMRLAEDRFYNTYPCIIITAKGQPDVATRCVGVGGVVVVEVGPRGLGWVGTLEVGGGEGGTGGGALKRWRALPGSQPLRRAATGLARPCRQGVGCRAGLLLGATPAFLPLPLCSRCWLFPRSREHRQAGHVGGRQGNGSRRETSVRACEEGV